MPPKLLIPILGFNVVLMAVREFTVQRNPPRRWWRVSFDFIGFLFTVAALVFTADQYPSVTYGSVFVLAQLSAWYVFWIVQFFKDLILFKR